MLCISTCWPSTCQAAEELAICCCSQAIWVSPIRSRLGSPQAFCTVASTSSWVTAGARAAPKAGMAAALAGGAIPALVA